MTKEVFVIIDGSQPDLEQESVVIEVPGVYHLRNGKHYIQYDEKTEDGKGVIQNTLKITKHQIDITKKGAMNSQMIFDILEATVANYQTPYGVLLLQIHTHLLVVEEKQEEIRADLNYTLSMDGNHISENRIKIIIKSKE